MIQAARKGLEGAVRHFLREDPACVRKADEDGGEAWLGGRDGLGRGFRRIRGC